MLPLFQMKKAAEQHVQTCSKEVGRLMSSVGEIFDVEDMLKSIHQVANPEQYSSRRSSVLHKTIDWSKHPPSAFRQQIRRCSSTHEEEEEEGGEGGGLGEEIKNVGKAVSKNRLSSIKDLGMHLSTNVGVTSVDGATDRARKHSKAKMHNLLSTGEQEQVPTSSNSLTSSAVPRRGRSISVVERRRKQRSPSPKLQRKYSTDACRK